MRVDGRGFVEVPAYVTRTGVLAYRRADGSMVRELRHPDEVFRADSLASLRGAPVTVLHPGDGLEFVDPTNADKHEVGVVAEGTRDGSFVDALLSVRRADAIRRVQAKELVEVSAGYTCNVVVESGSYEGQPYDQRQVDIQYNHVALLPPGKGRAGADVRLRADSTDALLVEDESHGAPPAPAKETPMATVKRRVDGVEYELPETAASMLDKLLGDRDNEKKRADKAETERDLIQGELATANDPKRIATLVGGRVSLERQAGKVLGQDKRFDGLTDREVHESVLKVTSPTFKTEGRSDDAVTAAFEYAIAQGSKKNHGLELVKNALHQGDDEGLERPTLKRADGSDLDLSQEFAGLEKKRADAWKAGA